MSHDIFTDLLWEKGVPAKEYTWKWFWANTEPMWYYYYYIVLTLWAVSDIKLYSYKICIARLFVVKHSTLSYIHLQSECWILLKTITMFLNTKRCFGSRVKTLFSILVILGFLYVLLAPVSYPRVAERSEVNSYNISHDAMNTTGKGMRCIRVRFYVYGILYLYMYMLN